jgi:TolB protein
MLASSDAKLGRCDHARTYINDALAAEPSNELALEAQSVCEIGAAPSTPAATQVANVTPTAELARPTRSTLPATLSGRVAFPVYNAASGMYDVYTAHLDGSSRRRVLEGFDQPAFSLNGQWLAVRGNNPSQQNLFVVRPDGSGLKQVARNVEDKLPYWSPDGGALVFASTKDQPGHPKAIYVIDPVPLEGAALVDSRRVDTTYGPVQGEHPSWMPDGRLVYGGCDYSVSPMSCGLFVINPRGGKAVQVTRNEHDAAPAGYGGRIAFMSNRDGNWEIYVVGDDGTGLRRLTDNASDDGLPAWSPDGKALIFVSNQGGPWAVWAMAPDGTGRQKLFDIYGGLDASWTEQRISWAP